MSHVTHLAWEDLASVCAVDTLPGDGATPSVGTFNAACGTCLRDCPQWREPSRMRSLPREACPVPVPGAWWALDKCCLKVIYRKLWATAFDRETVTEEVVCVVRVVARGGVDWSLCLCPSRNSEAAGSAREALPTHLNSRAARGWESQAGAGPQEQREGSPEGPGQVWEQ